VESITLLPKPKLWRALLLAWCVLLGIVAAAVWCWYILDQREQRETQHRFEMDMAAAGHLLEARMRAYEVVLRGISSAFVAADADVSQVQWEQIAEQLRVYDLYPGISSVVWSRYLRAGQLDAFVAQVHAAGRPGYQVVPEGQREQYLPIEFISPSNQRTNSVVGLDLLTQVSQSAAILQAIDSGQAELSEPLPDLYVLFPDAVTGTGVIMYFPVYQTGRQPATVAERRAAYLGMTNAAFRGHELVQGVFGAQLQQFHIAARDVETNLPIFDSQYTRAFKVPPGWQPRFRGHLDLSLYGRTWRLDITGTPEYQQGLISRSQDLVLVMGLSTAVLMALLTGAFIWQRDRQMYASQQVSVHLREQAEELMIANRYKSEFLANMSHELRTPLNSILILSDQLRQNATGNLTAKQMRHADIVYRAGNDLLQLINDVLDLAKIEAGRVQINLEPTLLQDVLVDVEAAMRPLARTKRLRLLIVPMSADGRVPQRVQADQVRLHQILRNLLSNAIKFTDEGEVHLEVSAGGTLDDGRIMLNFTVRDTGIGIDPEQHAQVFEAFQQLDGSTRRRFGGTGLGLPITKQLVEALDGTIELESAPGWGSTFIVHLPMEPVEDVLEEQRPAVQRSGSGAAVLIVEDDANFAAIIIEQAHAHGFSTVHCVTGAQALELLRAESFAAIILDILLPDISGWQLFRRLRGEPEYLATPVHIISCLPQPGDLDVEYNTYYLTKPIGRVALEQVFVNLRPRQRPSGGPPPLLLVEDVEAEREHYRQRLSVLGFAVTACSNAQDARTAWSRGRFDVLVVDMNLPDGDGFTLLEEMDALRPLQGTRIVINTGVDVTQHGLQRLNGYSAVVVNKHAADSAALGQAVQGFLGQVGAPAAAIPSTTTAAVSVTAAAAPASAAIVPADDDGILDAPPARPPPVEQPTLHGRRLLLVDDDIRNVYAMSAMLDGFGINVTTASNGEEAIARFREQPLELILMDISMPVMDGYTATTLLKTEYGCTIPIIALTAHAMKGDREKCLAAGADDYLSKPVKSEELRTLLEHWLPPQKG